METWETQPRRCDASPRFQGDFFELAVTQKSNVQIGFVGGRTFTELDLMYTCILIHNITFVLMTMTMTMTSYTVELPGHLCIEFALCSMRPSFQFVWCRSLEHRSPAKAARAAWQAKVLRWLNHFSCQLVPIISHFNLLVDSFVPMLLELIRDMCLCVCVFVTRSNKWTCLEEVHKSYQQHYSVFHCLSLNPLSSYFCPRIASCLWLMFISLAAQSQRRFHVMERGHCLLVWSCNLLWYHQTNPVLPLWKCLFRRLPVW